MIVDPKEKEDEEEDDGYVTREYEEERDNKWEEAVAEANEAEENADE